MDVAGVEEESLIDSMAAGLISLDVFAESPTQAKDDSESSDEGERGESDEDEAGVMVVPTDGAIKVTSGDAGVTFTQGMMARWQSAAAALPADVDAAYPTAEADAAEAAGEDSATPAAAAAAAAGAGAGAGTGAGAGAGEGATASAGARGDATVRQGAMAAIPIDRVRIR